MISFKAVFNSAKLSLCWTNSIYYNLVCHHADSCIICWIFHYYSLTISFMTFSQLRYLSSDAPHRLDWFQIKYSCPMQALHLKAFADDFNKLFYVHHLLLKLVFWGIFEIYTDISRNLYLRSNSYRPWDADSPTDPFKRQAIRASTTNTGSILHLRCTIFLWFSTFLCWYQQKCHFHYRVLGNWMVKKNLWKSYLL